MKKNKKTSNEQRYYYNEHDDNQVSHLYQTRRKKKRKLRLKRVLFVGGIIGIIGFLISPYSRVGEITIQGHNYMPEDVILEQAGVSEESIHALVSASRVEKNLEGYGLIETVECTRGFFNTLHIKIKEALPLAYQEFENEMALIGSNGEVYYIKKQQVMDMGLSVRLIDFTDKTYLEKFAIEYAKISSSIRSLISDITYSPEEPYDTNRIQFDMSDGKLVYVRLEDMASEMKYYQEILSTKPNACIYDIHGKNVYATECD